MFSELADRCREYLFQKLLPIGRDFGWDATRGGFHERLDDRCRPISLGYKRLVVQARQIFTFTHAVAMGVDDHFSEVARWGFDHLRKTYWDSANGGWFFSVSEEGEPLDRRKDLYGTAFVLFAAAHYARVFGRGWEVVEQTLSALEDLRAPDGRGYAEGRDASGALSLDVRRQNPHMHLLEALLAAEVTAARDPLANPTLPELQSRSDEIVKLLATVFFDLQTHTLTEFFTDDWQRHPQQGHIIEPGHHFEWCWLLYEYSRLRGGVPLDIARHLFRWGEQNGVRHGTALFTGGGFHDQVTPQGTVVSGSQRIWPATEYVKAVVQRCRYEQAPEDGKRLVAGLQHLFDNYLLADGRWVEHRGENGEITNPALPGTTSYHITFALSEALAQLHELTV